MFKATVMSCAKRDYKDKKTGEAKSFYLVYVPDAEGNVGGIFSTVPHKPGDIVNLALSVDRDGRFTVRISE